jgi:uncharacterized repeat protein (TIGR01451 family)
LLDENMSSGVFALAAGEHEITVVPSASPFNVGAAYFRVDATELVPPLDVTKQATPDPVRPGGQLTYTIRVTNTGNVDLHATITDTLPVSVTLGETSGGTLILPGGTVGITWTALITTPGDVWTETIVVTVAEGYEGILTNFVEVTTEEGASGKASVTVNAYRVCLPIVMQSYDPSREMVYIPAGGFQMGCTSSIRQVIFPPARTWTAIPTSSLCTPFTWMPIAPTSTR